MSKRGCRHHHVADGCVTSRRRCPHGPEMPRNSTPRVTEQDPRTPRSRTGDGGDRCRGEAGACSTSSTGLTAGVRGMGYGAQQAGMPPFFVVTTGAGRRPVGAGAGSASTFVDGVTTAVHEARSAATDGDGDQWRRDVIAQATEAGPVDELRLHVAPLLLGGGTPLFRAGTSQTYRQREVRPSRTPSTSPTSSWTSTSPSRRRAGNRWHDAHDLRGTVRRCTPDWSSL